MIERREREGEREEERDRRREKEGEREKERERRREREGERERERFKGYTYIERVIYPKSKRGNRPSPF